jgi:hypothetical protein
VALKPPRPKKPRPKRTTSPSAKSTGKSSPIQPGA